VHVNIVEYSLDHAYFVDKRNGISFDQTQDLAEFSHLKNCGARGSMMQTYDLVGYLQEHGEEYFDIYAQITQAVRRIWEKPRLGACPRIEINDPLLLT
jgi:hypothetical protein